MPDQFSPHVENRILAGVPLNELKLLEPQLELAALIPQATLHDGRALIEHVYFPLSGSVSLVIEFSDGFSTEAGEIGSEGMVGMPLVLGREQSVTTAKVQLSGTALRMAGNSLVAQFPYLPTLHRSLLRYAGALMARSAQISACNAHHKLDERLARCLISLHDRSRGNDLGLTHENLAALLCVHRPSISVSIKRLEQRGAIRQGSRWLTVTDRHSLERASCECHLVLRSLRDTESKSRR